MNSSLLAFIVLIIMSGLFSAAEIALTSFSEAKVRSLEKDKGFGSSAILKLKSQPQKVLVSILVGNQAANIAATVIATVWAIELFGENHISLATTIFALALIIFGSISPKTIALRFPEAIARITAYPLLGFVNLARPVVWFFEIFAKGILRLFKADQRELISATEAEIAAMLKIGAEKGVIPNEERVFMEQILKFGITQAGEIMTLLKNIEAIDLEIERKDLVEFIRMHHHSQFPVFEESLNNIKGIIATHELTEMAYTDRKNNPLKEFKLQSPLVIPKTTSLTELFKIFKEKKRRIAIVIDEHGQTIGLVTLGDILAEIMDMHLHRETEKAEPKIEKIGRDTWEADGEIPVSKVNKMLDLDMGLPEHEVLSLVVLEALKRFPEAGEKIQIDGIEIEILRVEKNIIKKLKIRRKKQKKAKSSFQKK